MKYRIIIGLALLLGLFSVHAQTFQQMESRNLSARDGLLSNQVYDIVQDRQGYIWFATSNGLSRYDGYSFLNYNMLNAPLQKLLQASLGNIHYDDRNGLLWVNTSTSYLSCYSLSKAQFVDYTGKDDYMRSYSRIVFDGSDVWLYDNKQGIRHISYKNGQFVCTDYTAMHGYQFVDGIQHISFDCVHGAWIIAKAGLYYVSSSGPQQMLKDYIIASQRIGDKMAFLSDRGKLYLFSQQGKLVKQGDLSRYAELRGKITATVGWNGQWILFMGKATYSIDINSLQVSKPAALQLENGKVIESLQGTDFVSARNGEMIIFTPQNGYRRLNLIEGVKDQGNRFRKYSICDLGKGRFLIATYGNGAFIYDIQRGVLEHITAGDDKALINSNFLIGALMDRSGNVWLSQEAGGVACLTKSFNTFMKYVYPAPGMQTGDNANAVLRILPDRDGQLRLMCKNKTSYVLDAKTLTVGSGSDVPYSVYTTYKDSRGHFWMGTRGGGLYVDGKLCLEEGLGNDVTINDVYSIVEDKMGRMWLATIQATSKGGLLLTNYKEGQELRAQRFRKGMENVHDMSMDSRGLLWIATAGGLCMVDTREKNISEKIFRHFNIDNGLLPFNQLHTVHCTSNGDVWIGGIGTGLLRCRYDAKKNLLRYTSFTTDNGLGSNNVASIIEDPMGFLWVGTESGLARVDVQTGRIDNNVVDGDDVQGCSYQENCARKLSDGTLLFGTNNGLVVVNPYKASIARAASAKVPTITDVLVGGQSVYKMSGWEGAPGSLQRVTFKHDQNTLTFMFSNFDYAAAGSSVYQYYLEGVDKGWNYATNKNSVSYNALQPGDYVFHVRTMGRGNQWSKERTLKVHISEPWYNRWYSWLVYICVLSAGAYRFYQNRKEKFQLNQRMKMEKQLNDFRINFFTHVTHEFRTPLAIIQSAVSKIVDDRTGAVSRASAQTAIRGTKRLSRLVTQLMEFRKINSDGVRLQVTADVEIIGLVRDIYQDLWHAAKQKDIVFNFLCFEKRYDMTCDRHIIETVVYNLLSNAVKYTPNRGEVRVKIEGDADKDELRIIVADSGPGISEEQQKNLFQPFMHGYVSQGGMGIGLYVAKMMAGKHHGSLVYERSADLGGACFKFTIPLSEAGYAVEDYLDTMVIAENNTELKDEPQMADIREMLPQALNDVTVAIIEDDPDMQEQIRTELAQYFKVVAYSNGKQGLEGVLADKPALLVCDVMLPDINGYDIVKQIKEQPWGFSLPVIMLTALNDEKHQIKGYKSGADDYMVKPCNFRLLVARIVQLITWSQKLEEMQTTQSSSSQTSSTRSTETAKPAVIDKVIDKKLLEKFESLVGQNISDPAFTIDTLAEMMHMGRTKLYGKIKELTGETPNKYIMKRRMKLAGELLLTGDYFVADVCYKVGLEDVSYFNKCFKSFYGVSPSKYGK